MADFGKGPTKGALDAVGIKTRANVYWNLEPAALVEQAVRREEGEFAANGALVTCTGARTGRSPNDRFVVREPSSEGKVAWGKVNRPIESDVFDRMHKKVSAHLADKDLFVQDLWAGADPTYRLPIRVISQDAWHSLFARQLFVRDDLDARAHEEPAFTVINAWKLKGDGKDDGLASDVFVLMNFAKRIVLVGGTGYAGEMKKSIFAVLNYVLPQKGVLSMHCSANVGHRGDVALFFGLSGTGKTTLSADPNRGLIGDDEHGWSDNGVFNFEGGCYAKCIRLSPKDEPEIYGAIRFGSVVENVVMDETTRVIDYDDDSITENTRCAYPLEFISNAVHPARAGHPSNVVFLTADAFGVLPPIARLTPAQAMYHFMSGYTAKVAGTEAGVTEPQATFSACFGEPFLPLHPTAYAELLGEKLRRHGATVWLVNTGWSGGPYGIGHRMRIPHTRAMLSAVLDGSLEKAEFVRDPVFGLAMPTSCPNVPAEVLNPRNTWKDKAAYDVKALDLAKRFHRNFERFEKVSEEIRGAGPIQGR